MAGGRKKLSGRQEDIRLQVTLSLCKYIIPEVLHRFDHFDSFFDDFVSEIEWGGEDYDGDVELSEEIALYDANEQ